MLSTGDGGIPVTIEPFMKEFSDVFPEELPPELRPIRDIQCHIDLILRASLPNKLTFCMSPKENEEMRRHVVELMENGESV